MEWKTKICDFLSIAKIKNKKALAKFYTHDKNTK